MTTSIPLSALPAKDEWRRDQWRRYLIVPPDGGEPRGYTRVTTVAKALDDGGGLAPWKATMTVCGVILRRGLRAQWEALMAEHGNSPWYAGEAAKADCKQLVKECSAVGGANDRAELGTSLHTITALTDLGRNPALTEETQRDVDAYQRALRDAGITVAEGLIETTVVLDRHQVAGTFDRGYNVPGFELPLIGDLKTGANLSYSWASIAVQLATYSRGDAIYRQGPAADGSEDVRLPMPAVDQHHGLIVWLNADTGECELFLVDLDAGWEAFEHSVFARDWRKRNVAVSLSDYRLQPSGDALLPALEASIAAVAAKQAPPATAGQVGGGPGGSVGPASSGVAATRAWLGGRIATIGAHPTARTDLHASWPADLPTLRDRDDHSAEQLIAMETLIRAVERRHKITFPPEPPTEDDAVALVLHMFPNATVTDSTGEAP